MAAEAMRLGLVGFGDEAPLAHALPRLPTLRPWVLAPAAQADAVWVSSERCEVAAPGRLRIAGRRRWDPAEWFELEEQHGPVAFALPLAGGLPPEQAVDTSSTTAMTEVLDAFERCLQPLAARLALARAIAARRYHLTSPVYHLLCGQDFLGIVNVHGDAGVQSGATPADLQEAAWCSRPITAGQVPAGFDRVPVAALMWDYAMRVEEDLLPERYHRLPIHFAAPPHVPPRLLATVHLELLALLADRPRRLDELARTAHLTQAQASQALAALYFAGCITTHAERAALGPRRRGAEAISGFGNDAAAEAAGLVQAFRHSFPGLRR